ncbi:MAG: hypothetical protein ACR2II_01805 [Chthoniobacterales bacterium]
MSTPTTTNEEPRTSGEIKEDIQERRGQMDNTLDRLNQRLSPRSLLNNVFDWFEASPGSSTSGAKKTGGDILDFVRDHPLPTLLTGAGILWMIVEAKSSDEPETTDYEALYPVPTRASRPRYRENGGDTYPGAAETTDSGPGAMDKLKEKAGAAGSALSEAGDAAKSTVTDAAETVKGQAMAAGRSLKRGKRQVISGLGEAEDRFKDAVQDYPLAVGTGFLGLGLLTGLLLPRTQMEDDFMGEESDQLIEAAKDKGGDLVERGKAVAERTADKAMKEAKNQGLTHGEQASDKTKNLGDKLSSVVTAAKEEAQQVSKDVGLTKEGLQEEAKSAGRDIKKAATEKMN